MSISQMNYHMSWNIAVMDKVQIFEYNPFFKRKKLRWFWLYDEDASRRHPFILHSVWPILDLLGPKKSWRRRMGTETSGLALLICLPLRSTPIKNNVKWKVFANNKHLVGPLGLTLQSWQGLPATTKTLVFNCEIKLLIETLKYP